MPHTTTSWRGPLSNTSPPKIIRTKHSACPHLRFPSHKSGPGLYPPRRSYSPPKSIAEAVHLATGFAVGSARALLPWERITKQTTSLVIQVSPTDAPSLIKKGIVLFNRVRPVRAMWSAIPATQCNLC